MFDPKLVKKVNHSQLILAAETLGIKNASKVTKEMLLPSFVKGVEALTDEEQENLSPTVVEMYNFIIKTFKLGEEDDDAVEEGADTEEPEEAEEAEEVEVAPPVKTKIAKITKVETKVVTKVPKEPKPPKPPKEPKPPKPPKAPKVRVVKTGWYQSASIVIKGLVAPILMDDLVSAVKTEHAKGAGSDNATAAKNATRTIVDVAVTFGIVSIESEEGVITITPTI